MENSTVSDESPKSDLGFAAALLLVLLSVIATAYGVALACGWIASSAIVGGDAYNIIIAGIRGVAWIGVGIVAVLLAISSFLLSRS